MQEPAAVEASLRVTHGLPDFPAIPAVPPSEVQVPTSMMSKQRM